MRIESTNGRIQYFDDEYLCTQATKPRDLDWKRLIESGQYSHLNPTRYFLTEWYAWQNPDWSHRYRDPYDHYLSVGRFEGRDPSPYVDMVRYRQAIGPQVSAEMAYDLLLAKPHSPWIGVYDGARDLRTMQSRFYREIVVDAVRSKPAGTPRRNLVFLQSGRGALTRNWMDDTASRNWDLLVNYYDTAGFVPHHGDYVFSQKGTKFTATWTLWQNYRSVFEPYDFVLFLDDDVETSVEDINQLFDTCAAHQLDLAQMTLSEGSSSNWGELFDQPNLAGPRSVSAVEIMMPVMSRFALQHLAPTFGKSVSGFGLDLTWGHIMRQMGRRVAAVDGIAATHARPVDQSDGTYYSYLRSNGINAKSELWALIEEFGAARDLISI